MDFLGAWTFVRALLDVLEPLSFEADSVTASLAFAIFVAGFS